jgi:hypothetical protein
MTQEFAPYPPTRPSPPPANTVTTRTYDAENHLNLTTFENGLQSAWPFENIAWGPDGHPITIGTGIGANQAQNERLHWNGNRLLFTTELVGGHATLDDIRIDVQGDILPLDSGYKGLTFYDRGPGGTIMGCHNYTGTSYIGMNDSWGTFGTGPCSVDQSAGANMPTSTVWGSTPYNAITLSNLIGQGGTLGMPRMDGISDGFDMIQGARSYDNTAGVWTTPDADGGVTTDPASQKSYLWSGNNPMSYLDPSGLDLLYENGTDGTLTDVGPPSNCGEDCGNSPAGCTSGPSCVSSDPKCSGCTPPSLPPVNSCSLDCQFARWDLYAATILGLPAWRVFGGGSPRMGGWWSLKNPEEIPGYESTAGLPRWNTQEWLIKGYVKDETGITVTRAEPMEPGQMGGQQELRVDDPTSSIQVDEEPMPYNPATGQMRLPFMEDFPL